MTPVASTLLVVDDNQANRDGLSQLLRLHGYAVTEGTDGHQALALTRQQPFDLILLDVMMAGLNGLEVLKALRTHRPATELPVIMTTAKGQSEDIVEALKLGANDYVTKPIDFAVLLARIQTQLSLKNAVERIRGLEQSLTARNQDLEAANTRMKRDLEAAARIQEAFLPPQRPRFAGVHSSWIFRPCEQLAGDMLNLFPLDGDHVGLYILDVSGHGVAAALLSVTLSHLLSPRRDATSLLVQPGDGSGPDRLVPPAEVADHLNARFPWEPATEQYFTIVYGILNVRTGELRYISAGHPGPVYLPSGGEPVLMERPSLPVGVGPAGYQEHVLHLQPGDRLYLYSDGLVEGMNGGQEPYGKKRLLEAVRRARPALLKDALALLWSELETWCGPAPRRDDVSLLAIELAGAPVKKDRSRHRAPVVAAND